MIERRTSALRSRSSRVRRMLSPAAPSAPSSSAAHCVGLGVVVDRRRERRERALVPELRDLSEGELHDLGVRMVASRSSAPRRDLRARPRRRPRSRRRRSTARVTGGAAARRRMRARDRRRERTDHRSEADRIARRRGERRERLCAAELTERAHRGERDLGLLVGERDRRRERRPRRHRRERVDRGPPDGGLSCVSALARNSASDGAAEPARASASSTMQPRARSSPRGSTPASSARAGATWRAAIAESAPSAAEATFRSALRV